LESLIYHDSSAQAGQESLTEEITPEISIAGEGTYISWDATLFTPDSNENCYVERQIEGKKEWETVGVVKIRDNRCVYYYDGALDPKLVKNDKTTLKFRLTTSSAKKGKIYSGIVELDLWWSKYLRLLEDPDRKNAEEVQKYVGDIVTMVIRQKFYTLFRDRGYNSQFYFDEVRQEIFSALLTKNFRPDKSFKSFSSFIYKMAFSWLVKHPLRDSVTTTRFDEFINGPLVHNAEEIYIEKEHNNAIVKTFHVTFYRQLENMWLQFPHYAISLEFWVMRKKEYSEEMLHQLADNISNNGLLSGKDFQEIKEEIFKRYSEKEANSSTCIYDGVLDDIMNANVDYGLINYRIKDTPEKVKAEFIQNLSSLAHNEASANRIRQWIQRGKAIIRAKMTKSY
jgi:hypothetical protein